MTAMELIIGVMLVVGTLIFSVVYLAIEMIRDEIQDNRLKKQGYHKN